MIDHDIIDAIDQLKALEQAKPDIAGPQNVRLIDDGTLDTVICWTCPDCGERVELRYDSDIRDYIGNTQLRLDEFAKEEWEALDGFECKCGLP